MTEFERFAEAMYRTALLFDLVRDRRAWDELTLGERQDWVETVRRAMAEVQGKARAA